MNLHYKTLSALFFTLNIFFLNAQPNDCPQGKEKSDYGFLNPCSSFIKWDVPPKNLGSVFNFDFEILKNKTFCIYEKYPSGYQRFSGKVELVENIKFPIIGHKNMTVNLTPCKENRFYVKHNFEYRYENWERYFDDYSKAKWNIEKQNKTPNRADSIFVLKTRKPSFGDYMALLYLELDSEVDFNVYKISEYLTSDKKYMQDFYENYTGKSYSYSSADYEQIRAIRDEYLRNINEKYGTMHDYFLSISLFFDKFYKEYGKYMPSVNAKELITYVYNFLNPPSRSYKFNPQYLIDKYYGSLQFGFEDEIIALEISNPNIKDISGKEKKLSVIVRADFKYQNLPYERIVVENEKAINFDPFNSDSFYFGENSLKIVPFGYSFDLDIYENKIDFGHISSFHQQYEKQDFPFRLHSDEYIQNFMGLYIEDATIIIKIQEQNYELENARLLIDDAEINGTVNIDFSKFEPPTDKETLLNLFKSNKIEAEIMDNNQLFFRVK
ncbi:MAG: hypothetical protein LBE36_04480 [Flavobacteriaceae bacterium]|jgi:hypothetical protein|nr:hypothetical protein [Flavobacteriaceae bacterium]